MNGDGKKLLKIAIIEFFKLNSSKGKAYTFKHFKKGGVDKTTIYRWLKKFEETGNCDQKPGSGTKNSNQAQIKMD